MQLATLLTDSLKIQKISNGFYIERQQCERARRSLNEALTLAREIRDPAAERVILNHLEAPSCAPAVSEQPAGETQAFDRTEAEALVNQGQELYQAGQIQAAIETWESALLLHQEANNCIAEAQTYGLLGNAFLESNQYEQAIAHQQLAVFKSRQSNDQQTLLRALGDLGNVYFVVSQYERAIEYYEEASAIAQATGDQEGEANSIGHLGASYAGIGDYDQAMPLQLQYLELAQTLNNRTMEAQAQLNLGTLYQFLGQPGQAIDAYETGLGIAHEINNQVFVVDAYGNLANAHYAWSYVDSLDISVQYYQLQFEAARRINDIHAQGFALRGIGLNFWKRHKLIGSPNDLNEAEHYLRGAIKLWESLRLETLTPEYRLSLLDSELNPYLILQQVLIQKGEAGAALEVAEQSRTQVLRADLLRHLSDQQKAKWLQSPDLKAIKEIAAIQNATLVEYSYSFVTDELMIWVVQPDGTVHARSQYEFSLVNILSEAGHTVSQLSATRGPGNTRGAQQSVSTAEIDAQLTELHRILIAPIADLLPEDEQDRVIFIPFGLLFKVPFAALRDPSGQYLIESHTIAIAPSIQSLALTREHRQRLGDEPGPALLVGDPTLSNELVQQYSLQSLDGAKAEVQAIANDLGVPPENVLIGQQATETIVKERLHTARIIHLATHGLLLEAPRYSTVPGLLALAPSGQDDGALEASEIIALTQNQPFNAELVVLSACRTGQGDITSDGIYGLTRAFLTAGVPSIVVSLWDVSDRETEFLMTRFYQELAAGSDKDQALRQAMLEIINEGDPAVQNWAAFMLVGEAK